MPALAHLQRVGALSRPSWRAVSATLQSRTNQIRNNSTTGAVLGAIGSGGAFPTNCASNFPGLTVTIAGIGTANGVDVIDYRVNGTTGGTFGLLFLEASSVIAAANAQTWACSVFLALVGGSVSNLDNVYFSIRQQDGAAATLSDLTAINALQTPIRSGFFRYSGTATTNNASVAFIRPFIAFAWSSAVAVDFTLRMGGQAASLGASAPSPIRTSGTARVGVHISGGR